ncbi:hypothetical protein [Acinetobacter puyangensis]|uniref:hypothetical protein n=1 Tax=Acinetobacter puyangensis TaxID=1096779 RepID=UPI003A4E2754
MSEASKKYVTVPQAVEYILNDSRVRADQAVYYAAYKDAMKMLVADLGENSLVEKSKIEHYIKRLGREVATGG